MYLHTTTTMCRQVQVRYQTMSYQLFLSEPLLFLIECQCYYQSNKRRALFGRRFRLGILPNVGDRLYTRNNTNKQFTSVNFLIQLIFTFHITSFLCPAIHMYIQLLPEEIHSVLLRSPHCNDSLTTLVRCSLHHIYIYIYYTTSHLHVFFCNQCFMQLYYLFIQRQKYTLYGFHESE